MFLLDPVEMEKGVILGGPGTWIRLDWSVMVMIRGSFVVSFDEGGVSPEVIMK